MAMVSYSGSRSPRGYGVAGSRSLASLYGGASMRPASSPRSFAPISQPISDVLNSAQVANRQRLAAVAPPASTPATSPTTPPATPPATAPAPPAGVSQTDLGADPILNQIKAIGLKGVQDRYTGGVAGAKNDLINYGSVEVPQALRDLFATQTPTTDAMLGDLPGNAVLAALNDAQTARAAAGNPFSTTKQLAAAHETNNHAIDQATNLANLFYSSTHANQLGQENENYLGAQNTALANLAALLSGENQGELGALDTAHQNYLNELPNAYARALAAGGSGDTTPPPPSAPGGNTGLDLGPGALGDLYYRALGNGKFAPGTPNRPGRGTYGS